MPTRDIRIPWNELRDQVDSIPDDATIYGVTLSEGNTVGFLLATDDDEDTARGTDA